MKKEVGKISSLNGVTVIIPNYNGRRLIDVCLASLYNQKVSPDEIIVVDNGSKDGSKELVSKKYPEVRMISFSKNQGFSRAVNKGIKKARFDKVFILNNDTKVTQDCLKFLLDDLERKAGLCAVAPKILFSTERIDSAGSFVNEFGKAFHRREKEAEKKQLEEVFLITGAAVLCRKRVFEKIGYFEDVDFCQRAKRAGFKIAIEPKSIIFHKLAEGKKKILVSDLSFITE